ncbi:hypothetical protein AM1_A0213 (plasmid) [Acaryochloris marina MBIC11017]|uniref:Uncharacterized protein n=1 Tax=Acaryochloris marina (strain MBIC 11017) TaxID=329726 RepID=A8ZKL6_ACAM1|nr:hypothetical protein AM1_A0213 [Acaryochloris marina MBIC11017]
MTCYIALLLESLYDSVSRFIQLHLIELFKAGLLNKYFL